jgi:hypothetical protein
VGEDLFDEAAAQSLVVDPAANTEEPVEGAPVVVLSEAQSTERLSESTPSEGKEVTENEGLSPKEGALLAKGASVGDEQMP